MTAFTALDSVSFARDSANQATVVTNGPHGIKTGNIITIRDFTGTTPETFNSTNVTATVLSDTSVQYFNTGDNTSVTADTNGKVDLAGTTQARNYIYSWITPWDEESIPSDPSETDFIKEGQVVTLNNLPTASPTIPAQNFIRGLRLYRTIPTASGTAYYKLTDAWYPVSVATVARSTNVATVEFADYHNLAQGDRFKISGCTDSSFNITDGEVLSVTGNKTITYTNAGADKATTADTSGKKYHDVAESSEDTARYFGDPALTNPFHFVDDFLFTNLSVILGSADNDAPPDNLQGLALAANGIFVGFFGVVIALWKLYQLYMMGRAVKAQSSSKKPNTNNPLGRVMKVGNDNLDKDIETLELKLAEAIMSERPAIERGINVVKIISVVAPLAGLLGTVTGMIVTFQQITLFGTGDPKIMAGGISQALVTTVLGLVVAIPTTLAHSFLQSSARSVVDVLEEQATGIVAEKAK